MKLQMNVNTELRTALSQAQIQFLQLLPMTNQELETYLENEMLENPLLERVEMGAQSFEVGVRSRGQEEDSSHMDYLMNLPQPEVVSLRMIFTEQLRQHDFSREQWRAILFLIDNVDDTGLFTMPMKTAAAISGLPLQTLQQMLLVLQSLEPCGCFAEDLQTCLLLQLLRQGCTDAMLMYMVHQELDDVLARRVTALSRKLSISTQRVRGYLDQISALNPRPLAAVNSDGVNFVVPDLICWQETGRWRVELNDSFFGSYGLSDYYCLMMQQAGSPELHEYFRNHYQRARAVLANVEQRRSFLLRLTELLLEVQQDYFAGTGPLRPFQMAEAAQRLEVSPSTVTRAVKNKYLQHPRGTLPMRALFPASVGDCGQQCVQQIKQRLMELIAAERQSAPYSDQQLAELLGEKGIQISRRTVAKYRTELGVLSCANRKSYA